MRSLSGVSHVESDLIESLGSHKNIIKFVDAATIREDGGKFVLILCELAPDGHLLDLLERYDGRLEEP